MLVALIIVALTGFILLNLLVIRHARAMLFFSPGGERTVKPEALSAWQKIRVLLTAINLPRPQGVRRPSDVGLTCEEREIPCAGGIRLAAWYVPEPNARTLAILFHGYGGDKSSLLTEAAALHSLGCSVLLVDFRGSGGSSESYTTVGWVESEDVVEAVAYARDNLSHPRVVLYGQSMGGAAVLRAMAVSPVGVGPRGAVAGTPHRQVGSVCHGPTPTCSRDMRSRGLGLQADGVIIEAVFDTMLQTVRNRFHAMGLPCFPGAEILMFWGSVQLGFNGFVHRPVDYARSVRCPALFMQGTHDPRATLSEGRRVFESAPGPKCWKEFAGVEHQSCAEAQPGEWTAAVGAFLKTIV